MSKKSLLILIVLALVSGGLALWLNRTPSQSETPGGKAVAGAKLLGDLDLSKVAALSVQTGEASVTLKRGADKKWTVAEREGYPADASRLSECLNQLADAKITQVQEAGPSQYPRLQMADPAAGGDNGPKKEEKGTLVKLLDEKDTPIMQVVLGKSPSSGASSPMSFGGGNGRFVRTVGNEGQVSLISDGLTQLTAAPADWINKTFLQPGTLKRIAVSGPQGFQAWEVTKDKPDGQFVLKDPPAGKQLSQTAAGSWSSLLGYAQPVDVMSAAEAEKIDKKEARTITLENTEGVVMTFTVIPLPKDPPKDAPKPGEDASAASTQTFYAVTVEVKGAFTPPAPPPPPVKPSDLAADANEEAKKKHDEEQKAYDEAMKQHGEALKVHEQTVATLKKTFEEKLAKDQELAKRVFKFNNWTFESIWKTRDEITEAIPPPPTPPSTEPPSALTPGGAPGAPPAPAPAGNPPPPPPAPKPGPISVTTPPIAVPPLDEAPKPDAPKPDAPKPDAPKP